MPDDPRPSASTLTFDARAVPCDGEDVTHVLFPLRHAVEHPYAERAELAAEILAGAPDPTDADALHRYLLQTRKRLGRYSPAHNDLEATLEQVRPHSGLYTERTCRCLFVVWDAFGTAVADLLTDPDPDPVWAVAAGGQPRRDLKSPQDVRDLAAYTGRGYGPGRRRIPTFLTVTRDGDTLTWSGDRRRPELLRGRRLTTMGRRAAARVEYCPQDGGWISGPGAWVLTWPPRMDSLVVAWASSGAGRGCAHHAARAMLAAGAADLDDDGWTVAHRLCDGWQDSAEVLVRTAAAVAAHVA